MITKSYFAWGKVGFTLVELLVSMAILSLLMLVLVSITDATQRTWAYTTGKVEQFRDAREGFESITRKVSQATLNTYWDYEYPGGNTALAPSRYVRQSELRFISGTAATLTGSNNMVSHAMFFQAPLGYVSGTNYANLNTLLNTWGYFVEFGSDKPWRPQFLNTAERYRFRVMEMMEPSEQLTLYTYTSGSNNASTYTGKQWFTKPLSSNPRPVRVVAENVIALVILPKLTPQEDPTGSKLSQHYGYDSSSIGEAESLSGAAAGAVNSKNQLPPVIQITMVAVDEASFQRLIGVTPLGTVPPMPTLLTNLFKNVGDISNSGNPGYARDLQTLQQTLQDRKLNYRVFTTNVAIKAAKWSRAQEK